MNTEAIIAKLKQYPLAVVSVALALVLVAVIYLRSGRVPTLKENLEEKETSWSVIQNNDLRAVDMQKHIDKITAMSEEIDSRLLVPGDKAINYQYLFQIEQRSGVRLENLQQKPLVEDEVSEHYAPIYYDLSASGTYKEILNFIYELQNGRFFTRIDRFSCNAVGELEPNLVQVNLKMAVLGVK